MKKQIIYLILLSLMACKKPDCTSKDVVTPVEEPKKPPLVDCKLPTRSLDTAKILITGKWRLTRTVLAGFLGVFHGIPKEKQEMVFKDNGTFDLYITDTLKLSSNYSIDNLVAFRHYCVAV